MNILDFLYELFELDECMCTVGEYPIIVGDFNCPGTSEDVVDHRLHNWLICYNLVAINNSPTRMHHNGRLNKLDLIIERVQPRRLQNAVTMIGYSDHRRINAVLRIARPHVLPVTYTYGDYGQMDILAFRSSVHTSKSMLSPSADLDDAVRNPMRISQQHSTAMLHFVNERRHRASTTIVGFLRRPLQLSK